ncbi:Protein RTA1 [Paramyrothecium foliicola]|nr:Protein RTA1 [Paramyrothecium foliicola]
MHFLKTSIIIASVGFSMANVLAQDAQNDVRDNNVEQAAPVVARQDNTGNPIQGAISSWGNVAHSYVSMALTAPPSAAASAISEARSRASEAVQSAEAFASTVADSGKAAASSALDRAKSAAASASNIAASATSAAGGAVNSATESAGSAASSATESAEGAGPSTFGDAKTSLQLAAAIGGGFGESPTDRADRLNPQPAKRQLVAQACRDCRRTKIKCDGKRPKCSACIVKDRPCGYVENRPKTRLELLEKLMAVLRAGTQTEAEDLLQRIRAAGDLHQAADEQFEETSTGASSTPASRHNSIQSSTGASSQESLTATSSAYRTSSSDSQPSVLSIPNSMEADSDTTWVELDQLQPGKHTDRTSTSHQVASNSRSPIDTSLEPPIVRLPDASLTLRAVESFFNCSGKLFHVFTHEQASEMYRAVFETQHNDMGPPKVAIGALMALAAVGAQYLADDFNHEATVCFYNIARYYFEAILEQQPFDSIRVCALLAQYNILDKAVVSLAYVEIGLGMSRMYGLSTELNRVQSLPDSDWIGLQKTVRTLIFFSSWLSSTLGYISGNDLMSDKLNLIDIVAHDSTDMAEVVQSEMTKICVLKSNIIRMQWNFHELTADAMHSIMRDLQTWYGELPEMMRLGVAGQEDMPIGTRRSVLHVHLLYLGAMILLYRQLALRFVQSYRDGGHASFLQGPLHNVVLAYSSEVALAASTSARIIKLLFENNSIFKRCWLVIFQTYTTCTMLLHVAVQKQLHGFQQSTWQAEKAYAEDCLSVLSFCGTRDRIAAQYHEKLTPIFERVFHRELNNSELSTTPEAIEVLNQSQTDPHGSEEAANLATPLNHGFLLSIPHNANPVVVEIAVELMTMLSKPFEGSLKSQLVAKNTTKDHPEHPARHEHPVAESLGWMPQGRGPFQWDFNKLNTFFPDNTASGHEGPTQNYNAMSHLHDFVDSAEPIETFGFAARIVQARQDPSDENLNPTIVSTFGIILAPVLFAASMYMMLGRIIRVTGAEAAAMIRPSWSTKIFVLGDIASFLVQLLGVSLVTGKDLSKHKLGGDIILLGLYVQVAFFLFYIVNIVFFWTKTRGLNRPIITTAPWKLHLEILLFASMLVLTRSAFRVIEYHQGVDGELMSKEAYMYCLDAGPMLVMALLFNVFHPSAVTGYLNGTKAAKFLRMDDVEPLELSRQEEDIQLRQANGRF